VKKCDPALVRLQMELADVGTMAEGLNQRAEEVLEALGRILPFDAGWLAVRDPERRRHVPLATTGAAEPLRRYFESPGADAEVEHLGLNSAQRPLLASELPEPLPEICAWGEYLLPAGFRGGVAGALFASTGRHVGFLSLLAEDPARPSLADRQILAAVTRVIADDLDRTQEIATIARIVGTAEAGVVLTRGEDALPLPGCPTTACWPPTRRSSPRPRTSCPPVAPTPPSSPPRRARTASGWCGSAHWIAHSPTSTTCRPQWCCPPPGSCAA
jgi:GAF domain-containing protein